MSIAEAAVCLDCCNRRKIRATTRFFSLFSFSLILFHRNLTPFTGHNIEKKKKNEARFRKLTTEGSSFIASRSQQSDSFRSSSVFLFFWKNEKTDPTWGFQDGSARWSKDNRRRKKQTRMGDIWHVMRSDWRSSESRGLRLQLHGGGGGMRKDKDQSVKPKKNQEGGRNKSGKTTAFRRQQTPFLCKITIWREAGPARDGWQPLGRTRTHTHTRTHAPATQQSNSRASRTSATSRFQSFLGNPSDGWQVRGESRLILRSRSQIHQYKALKIEAYFPPVHHELNHRITFYVTTFSQRFD